MIRNIIYAVIVAAVVTVSWQVGSILLEKRGITYLLEEQANSVKKYQYTDGMIEYNLEKELKQKGLPTQYTIEVLEEGNKGKVRISYRYNRVASVFGYPYYQVDETISAETKN